MSGPDGAVPDHLLSDLLVVDLSRVLTGPFAAMMLGDNGARVIKVERPEGDDTRHWGPPFVGEDGDRESTYFLSANRNKESIVLDFKDPEDLAVLRSLIARADVLIENFKPGVLERYGLDDETLLELNPRLIVLSISAFGHDGPESARPGYDQIVQGEAGLMSLTGPEPGSPTKVGLPMADLLAGMFGAFGVLGALHERERTGRGQVVRTSLLAGIVAIHTFQGTRYLIGGEVPREGGNHHPTIAPYGMFPCSDGLIQIAIGNDLMWERLATTLGLDPADERFVHNELRVDHREVLEDLVGERLRTETVEHWLSIFTSRGIPAGEVKSLDQVYANEQVASQELVLETEHATLGTIKTPGPPLKFSRTAPVRHAAPPTLGQHSEKIRRWLKAADGEPVD